MGEDGKTHEGGGGGAPRGVDGKAGAHQLKRVAAPDVGGGLGLVA